MIFSLHLTYLVADIKANTMRFMIITALLLLTCELCLAITIKVPGDYPQIQRAIDAASDSDLILVAPGLYMENIHFSGKAIIVRSSDGPDFTTIDGGMKKSVVTFKNDEGPDSIIDGFTITNGAGNFFYLQSKAGGGIYCEESSPQILNSIIKDNITSRGGGIYCCGQYPNITTPYIFNCVILNNEAEYTTAAGYGAGGGIFLDYSDATILDCLIQNNTCGFGGGGIWAAGICYPIIKNNRIDNNSATYHGVGRGGGYGCGNGVRPTIEGNRITNNVARVGAGILCWAGTISNNIIMYNTASLSSGSYVSGGGGGICIFSNTDPITLRKNTIAFNHASISGGGIFWGTPHGVCINNHIHDNSVSGGTEPTLNIAGGGIQIELQYGGNPYFINNIITNNYSDEYGGGVYVTTTSVANFINCTLSNNSSAILGNALYCEADASIQITNSIIWDNPGQDIYFELNPPIITYSNLPGNWPGAGNIKLDPEFINPAANDFHILYTSPCREVGDGAALNLPSTDFEGNPRVAYGAVDMGADEFYPHLYCTGSKTPLGYVRVNFIGLPGTLVNALIFGPNLLGHPLPCDYGTWYFQNPMCMMTGLGTISPDGIFDIWENVPYNPPAPYTVYLQAAIDYKLTDLCTLHIE